jgi:hypothetical protein
MRRPLSVLALAALLAGSAFLQSANADHVTTLADRQHAVGPRAFLMWFVPERPAWSAYATDNLDPDLTVLLNKRAVYSTLCNETMRFASSWADYAAWADLEHGPTTREPVINGLGAFVPYEVKAIRDVAHLAAALTTQSPGPAELDSAVNNLIPLIDPALAIINEADAYYTREDYKDDGGRLARAYHEKLVLLVPPLLAARERVSQQIDALSDQIEQRELKQVETGEGKRYYWYLRRVIAKARKLASLIDADPQRADRPDINLAAAEYAAVVREFDTYLATPGAQHGPFESSPQKLLASLRQWREGKRDVWSLVQQYNQTVQDLGRE